MRKITNTVKVLVLTGLFVVISSLTMLHPALAAGASLTLSPSSTSVQNGSNLTLTVNGNTGSGSADGVNITLSYDPAKLSFVSLNTTPPGGTATINSGANYANSSATIAGGAYTTTPISGNFFLLSVTFKALVGSGASSVQFSTTGVYGTELDSGGNTVGATLSGATVNFTTPPAPTCPSGYSGTYPSCTPLAASTPAPSSSPTKSTTTVTTNTSSGSRASTSSGGTQPTTKSNTTTPAVNTTPVPVATNDDTVTIGDKAVEFDHAKFSVVTKAPVQVYMQYGLSPAALTSSTLPDTLGTQHSVNFDAGLLVPGQTYYYSVVTKDASGTITQSKVESFTTKGLSVAIGVFDQHHEPLKHKQVTLHSTAMTGTTDDTGYVTFSNVIPGDHHVSYGTGKQAYSQPIKVINNVVTKDGVQTAALQTVKVTYGLASSGTSLVLPLLIGLVLLAGGGAAVFWKTRKLQPTPVVAGAAPAAVAQSPVTIQPMVPIIADSPLHSSLTTREVQPGSTIMPKDQFHG